MWESVRIDEFVDGGEDILVTAHIGQRVGSVFLYPWEVVFDLHGQIGGAAFALIACVGGGELDVGIGVLLDVNVHLIFVVGHDGGRVLY